MQTMALLFGFLNAAWAGGPAPAVPPAEQLTGAFGGSSASGQAKNPLEQAQEDQKEQKTQDQQELEARLQQIEEAEKAKQARVVVLQWQGTDTDYTSEALQRNVKARIARPDAHFYPEIDLYQAGRKEPDPSLRPADQRAIVPDDAVARVLAAVEDVASIPWNALSEQDWGLKANELYQLQDEVWFVDRPELREARFLLYAQIGRAAESSNNPSPPYYENVDGQTVNYYWYLAGAMAFKTPELMAKITDQSLNASIAYYKDALDAGSFDPLTLSFDLGNNEFDPKAFTAEYTVWINGVEETIKNPKGLLDVPPGKVDIYMKRADGHSLSDRIDITLMQEKFYFVRQNARKRMGLDFIDQLMAHPFECTPDIAGDILNYLSIYAKLHPQAEIYIAVPKAGSTAPGRLFLWRWDREKAVLVRVQDNTGGFPIRFAALIGTGVAMSGVDVQQPTDDDLQAAVQAQQPGQPISVGNLTKGDAWLPKPTIEGMPFYYHLRGHYNHFFAAVGIEYKFGFGAATASSGKAFADMFQTTNHDGGDPEHADAVIQVDQQTTTCTGTGTTTCDGTVEVLALRERDLQRLVFGSVGVMLGRDSASGWGPRGYYRMGWYNVPHAVDFTLHAGYTGHVGPKSKEDERKEEGRMDRVRAILDADFFGGMLVPYFDSLYVSPALRGQFMALGHPFGTFGFTVGAGLTF